MSRCPECGNKGECEPYCDQSKPELYSQIKQLEADLAVAKSCIDKLKGTLKSYYANDNFIMWLVASKEGRECDPTKYARQALAEVDEILSPTNQVTATNEGVER